MVNFTQHNLRQLAHQRGLWAVVLVIWLFTASVSLTHSQEHFFSNDNQCQLCLSSFNHTPFIASITISLSVIIQHSIFIVLPVLLADKQPPAIFYNRGPPQ